MGDLAGGTTPISSSAARLGTAGRETRRQGSLAALKKLPSHEEGFVVAGADVGGVKLVALAGQKPLGCLYAVYDYLERDCGVGFFQDGEHVPHLATLPAEAAERIEQPRFDNRLHFAWNSHRA